MALTWLPQTQGRRVIWIQNFKLKVAAHAAALGIPGPEVTAIVAALEAYVYAVSVGDQAKRFSKSSNTFKDNLWSGSGQVGAPPPPPTLAPPPPMPAAGVARQLSRFVKRLKATPGYSTPIGKDLGIEPPDRVEREDRAPRFRLVAQPGSIVEVHWIKAGFSGVIVESRRGDSPLWEVIGRDFFAPFRDARPPLEAGKAEVRSYRLQYLRKDDPVGPQSNEAVISTMP